MAAKPLRLPSYSTMVRNINAIAAGRYLTGSARTRRSLGNRPHRIFKKQERILPGAEIQVDSTTMDVLIRKEDGKTARPVLTHHGRRRVAQYLVGDHAAGGNAQH